MRNDVRSIERGERLLFWDEQPPPHVTAAMQVINKYANAVYPFGCHALFDLAVCYTQTKAHTISAVLTVDCGRCSDHVR